MALDSELNVLSEAKDVAFQLRSELFSQCSGMADRHSLGIWRIRFKNGGKALL